MTQSEWQEVVARIAAVWRPIPVEKADEWFRIRGRHWINVEPVLEAVDRLATELDHPPTLGQLVGALRAVLGVASPLSPAAHVADPDVSRRWLRVLSARRTNEHVRDVLATIRPALAAEREEWSKPPAQRVVHLEPGFGDALLADCESVMTPLELGMPASVIQPGAQATAAASGDAAWLLSALPATLSP